MACCGRKPAPMTPTPVTGAKTVVGQSQVTSPNQGAQVATPYQPQGTLVVVQQPYVRR